MSRYPPPDYRGARERSRSPPHFSDRPPRSASDAPRGPRSQYDSARPLPPGAPPPGAGRPPFTSLRDAPPLGSDRGRPYRERDYDRRDRLPSPRDRSPRIPPPRDLDIARQRRNSRDGPPPGSSYPDSQPPSAGPFRGGFARGRGRGEFSFRGGRGGRGGYEERGGRGGFDDRGGRNAFEDRELIRRPERSPPRPWARDLSRDSRDTERRDERRPFERREDERRPEWQDRERDFERPRRDPLPPPRLEARNSNDSVRSANAAFQTSQASSINPDRLALIEGAGVDIPARRQSTQQEPAVPPPPPQARDVKRDAPETPAYLNSRAATTAQRYGTRGSSSPQQAPPVPAFTLSFAAPAASSAPSSQPPRSQPGIKGVQDSSQAISRPGSNGEPPQSSPAEPRSAPPADAPIAPRVPPPAPKAHLTNPPPAAPRGPRAQDGDDANAPNRLHPVRSLESVSSQGQPPQPPAAPLSRPGQALPAPQPTAPSTLPTLNQPVTPHIPNPSRLGDFGPPTGPRASRPSPAAQSSVSPRPPFASPRSDFGAPAGPSSLPRTSTPPPTAPTGPRGKAYSVSPKAAPPTAPKGQRGPPVAPRGQDRVSISASRVTDRLAAPMPWGAPTAPRGPQWNQWKRPGVPGYGDKVVPAKRDVTGEEKAKAEEPGAASAAKVDDAALASPAASSVRVQRANADEMEVDQPPKRQSSLASNHGHGHSAAQSFFGKPVESVEEDDNDTGMSEAGQEVPSSSDDDESDIEDESLTLFHAKFERQKRQLEAQMTDLRQSPYRAMSPLESISRLVRISGRDLQRVNEIREREMEVDDSPVVQNQQLLPGSTRSSDSADGPALLTPKGEEDHAVAIRSSNDSAESVRRIRRPSPEPISLPYLLKEGRHSLHDSKMFEDRRKEYLEAEEDLMDALEDRDSGEQEEQEDAQQLFSEAFLKWREECEDLDREREELERLERQQSVEPRMEADGPKPPMMPTEGSRRQRQYNSEYELQQALKESEETARLEEERKERETRKNQADMEKEAVVGDQMTDDIIRRGTFVDTNRYRDPEALTMVFSYDPAPDNFTENEQQIFVAAFKETPKKWGEIASLLPGRTYEDCIRHYYAKKWDARFRDSRTKKLKHGAKRGRGSTRGARGRLGGLMADLARAEDISIDAMSEKGRPRRAAAPTNFAEKEIESKAALLGQSPAKKLGLGGKAESNGDAGSEKSVKKQKRTGEKAGRGKGKAAQPLLAAAPQGSPAKQFLQREEQAQQQKLEEAGLLAGLQAGRQTMHPEVQMMYNQERFLQPMAAPEEPDRSKPAGQGPTAKQSASSYWSVPEQHDFQLYIAHFGRDFAAIAAHMGTKTQTMIKNHYQRQVDSGNKPELERSAIEAEQRINRGEDLGPPPTPTPITKRKYDTVPSNAQQRPLAPQGEAMEVDERGPAARVQQVPKHASPPQYQPQPRMTTSTQNTPVPAVARVVPSPPVSTSAPGQQQIAAASRMGQGLQHPLGHRLTFMSDTRAEPRPPQPQQPGFALRAAEDPSSRPPSQQTSRVTVTSDVMERIREEQQRAFRLQQQEQQQPPQPERMEQLHRQNLMPRNLSQGSPLNQPLSQPPMQQTERKSANEERPPSPQRPGFLSSGFARPSIGSSGFSSFASNKPFASLTGRSPFSFSPTKREEPRPAPMSMIPPANTTSNTPAPPEPPKRSNVMSLLNNDDDPPPPKRDNPPPQQQQPQRTASPASQQNVQSAGSSIPGMRRETSFGQSSMQGQLGRGPFGQPNRNPTPGPPTPKNEPGPPKPDWTSRILGPSSSHGAGNPGMDRDRGFFQHGHRSSLLGSLNQQRGNPSPPPPLGGIGHSRTPSLTGQSSQQAHDQARQSMMGQQQQGPSHQPAQALQSNPYGAQQMPPFSQPPPSQAQNQAHHSHNGSMGGPFPSLHHRGMSREDQSYEQYRQDQQHHLAQRDREEREIREMRWRQQELERRHEDERQQQQHFAAQQQQQQRQQMEQQQQQQAMQHHRPPQPLQPPTFGGTPFIPSASASGGGRLDLRRQSQMDGEMAMREEVERLGLERERRRLQEEEVGRRREEGRRMEEEFRRREAEGMGGWRRTPLGGFGGQGQGPQGQGGGRR
ncbi:uncharacterized protein LTR77_008428 [Saxophila tyrrhenica]|uniref:SANT domain-containing protein n=1 Tax=Saxophila tyrrhenica TaxID=1690608 RepID=A0AAV9P3U3_9PEZI|nr:hypothetical protein LTR77_008428 [Saxophila tyrrhenica]